MARLLRSCFPSEICMTRLLRSISERQIYDLDDLDDLCDLDDLDGLDYLDDLDDLCDLMM